MALRLSRYLPAVRQHAVVDAWDTSTNTISPISYLEYVTYYSINATNFAASSVYPVYTMPNDGKTWKIVGVSYRFGTQATGAATFSVEVTGAGVAPGSGTAQTGSLTLQGTANTTVNATLSAQTTVSNGFSINLVTGSTATTGLVDFNITISLQRVS